MYDAPILGFGFLVANSLKLVAMDDRREEELALLRPPTTTTTHASAPGSGFTSSDLSYLAAI